MDKAQIDYILLQHIRNRKDREIMSLYLTDFPGSLELLAQEAGVSWSTVKRAIKRCAFIYKYIPVEELKLRRN